MPFYHTPNVGNPSIFFILKLINYKPLTPDTKVLGFGPGAKSIDITSAM